MDSFERRALAPGQIDLWIVDTDLLVGEGALLARYEELLDPGERMRWLRFTFAPGRHQFLVTRALVRTALSRYTDVEPRAWSFQILERGRPRIAGPPGHEGLDFNLSHTEGLVALAVTRERELGVDVENVERKIEVESLADRFFSPFEAAALAALEPVGRKRRFFDYWTLKEAYIKARGLGLALPLASFSYELDRGPAIAISIDPDLGDDPATWEFAQFEPTARHLVGLAARRLAEPVPTSIRVGWTVPLVNDPSSASAGTLGGVSLPERRYRDPSEFLAALEEAGASSVVVRHIDEHRPVTGTSFVAPEKYRRVELVGYRNRVVYKCVIEGIRPSDLAEKLAAAGLTVKIVSGNIT